VIVKTARARRGRFFVVAAARWNAPPALDTSPQRPHCRLKKSWGRRMSQLNYLLEELVTANRILAREEVVDSFGHISVRHPDNPQRFLLSRARAPDLIEKDDIMEFTLDGAPVDAKGRHPYLERFIHGGLYEARPDVHSVVHNHSESVIPFGVSATRIKPIFHMGSSIGHEVPVWDVHDHFGDTALLVENAAMGRDLAKLMGVGPTALMRGHGATVAGRNIRHAVYISIYLEVNARLQQQAQQMGDVKFLTKGEVDNVIARTGAFGINRAWENWCRRAGRTFLEDKH
jgi:HCOMODA/2-hydroxy-3-carboxy-muconic semialdehyde decarboxylase